jgi:uncharacterized membrane protein HdeD (DUF308 family)
MLQLLTRNWWTLALRGGVAILFGIAAFIWPMATALAFVILLAAFAFVEGVFALVGAFGWGLPGGQRLLLILLGLLGLAVGIFAVTYPGLAAVTIVLWVGWWAIIAGIIQIVVAVEMRKQIENEWMLVLGAILSVIFGILLLYRPLTGVLTLTWLFGFYAILYGIVMLVLGFRLRSLPSRLTG